MTRKDQKRFVRELSKAVVQKILDNIWSGKVPESWDGFELRRLLADRFQDEVATRLGGTSPATQLRRYRREKQSAGL